LGRSAPARHLVPPSIASVPRAMSPARAAALLAFAIPSMAMRRASTEIVPDLPPVHMQHAPVVPAHVPSMNMPFPGHTPSSPVDMGINLYLNSGPDCKDGSGPGCGGLPTPVSDTHSAPRPLFDLDTLADFGGASAIPPWVTGSHTASLNGADGTFKTLHIRREKEFNERKELVATCVGGKCTFEKTASAEGDRASSIGDALDPSDSFARLHFSRDLNGHYEEVEVVRTCLDGKCTRAVRNLAPERAWAGEAQPVAQFRGAEVLPEAAFVAPPRAIAKAEPRENRRAQVEKQEKAKAREEDDGASQIMFDFGDYTFF